MKKIITLFSILFLFANCGFCSRAQLFSRIAEKSYLKSRAGIAISKGLRDKRDSVNTSNMGIHFERNYIRLDSNYTSDSIVGIDSIKNNLYPMFPQKRLLASDSSKKEAASQVGTVNEDSVRKAYLIKDIYDTSSFHIDSSYTPKKSNKIQKRQKNITVPSESSYPDVKFPLELIIGFLFVVVIVIIVFVKKVSNNKK